MAEWHIDPNAPAEDRLASAEQRLADLRGDPDADPKHADSTNMRELRRYARNQERQFKAMEYVKTALLDLDVFVAAEKKALDVEDLFEKFSLSKQHAKLYLAALEPGEPISYASVLKFAEDYDLPTPQLPEE